jgi:fluoroacetyl-CoA thioesterase
MLTEPTPGSEGSVELTVTGLDLASALPLQSGDAFPEVLATARMIALMEIAAARLLQPVCPPGDLSVGVVVNIQHRAPTPLGARVSGYARYLGKDGRLFVFDVWAVDAGGEIGRGTHKRAIVQAQRLQDQAGHRMASGT